MKKQDIIIIVLLFGLLMGWTYYAPKFFGKSKAGAQATSEVLSTNVPASAEMPRELDLPDDTELTTGDTEPELPVEEAESDPVDVSSLRPEQIMTLGNECVELSVSSHDGAIVSAILKKYKETESEDSSPVVLDFNSKPALKLVNWGKPVLDFDMASFEQGGTNSIVMTAMLEDHVALRRTITMYSDYSLRVNDELINTSLNPYVLTQHGIQSGVMTNLPGDSGGKARWVTLGVDTLSPEGESVRYWGGKFKGWFKEVKKQKETEVLPISVVKPLNKTKKPVQAIEWAAVKNKYFTQILNPDVAADSGEVYVKRDAAESKYSASAVSATLNYMPVSVEPDETYSRAYSFYVGPKEYSELKKLAHHQVKIMEFGWLSPISTVLLSTLNGIHKYMWPHNYGLAIILLTIIVRVIFWPITHKSTESMKRMQDVQPQITEIREKYKDNAQKMQREIMAVYKENKINPVGGCLPLVIQIPVFFALFRVLRNAIELRFASFLWVSDLSQPEGLFADVLPIPINILPILMAGTMAIQQHLTPTSGDPNQKKMMMFMPIMMLFFLYPYASGLSLYWTTNQTLMIVQMLYQRWQKKRKAELEAATA